MLTTKIQFVALTDRTLIQEGTKNWVWCSNVKQRFQQLFSRMMAVRATHTVPEEAPQRIRSA